MRRVHFLIFVLLVCVGFVAFAGGQPEIPEIPPITSGTQYLSPNGDGVKETAAIQFSVTIYVKSKEGYVPEYGLEIKDQSGEIIKQVVEKEDRDIGWLRSLFTGYKEFTLERSVTWDGKDADGNVADDGTYGLSLWVMSASGVRQEQALDDFIVDTKAPEALIVEPERLVFSPNNDGNRDEITISHTKATVEKEWTAEIRSDSGEVVRTFSWTNSEPGRAVWDGTADNGTAAPEGTYSYVLSTTDEAGNESGEIALEGIELDRTSTPIEVVIDPQYISPNGDGRQDTARVFFDQAVEEGIIGWEWKLSDKQGRTVLSESGGTGDVPRETVLDGTGRDGAPLSEGDYTFTYALQYRNGNNPSVTELFVVDVSPPKVSLNVDNPVFSPDGDGRKDTISVGFTADEEVTWQGTFIDENGESLLETSTDWKTDRITWDGVTPDGEKVDPGTYTLLATFTDLAGNSTDITPANIKIDIRPVDVKLAVDEPGFSPNGDNRSDFLPIRIDANQYDDVQRWTLQILGSGGEVQRVFSGEADMPGEVVWDGNLMQQEDLEMQQAAEGRYTAKIDVEYMKGKSASDTSSSFVLDVTPPRVGVKVIPDPFARTDEGLEGDIYITVDVQEETEVTDWTMDILDSTGDVIRTYNGEGDPSGDITWSAGKGKGEPAIDVEQFTLKLQVSDSGGNVREYSQYVPLDIFLVKRNGKLHIAVPNIIFGAYKHTLDSRGAEMEERNLDSISKVVDIYDRYPAHDLLLEGHALNIYRGVSGSKEAAEEEILVPLTKRRAETVRDALVERGMPESKIEIEYYGGTRPIVSVHDSSIWWKNRRVEFIMKKNPVE